MWRVFQKFSYTYCYVTGHLCSHVQSWPTPPKDSDRGAQTEFVKGILYLWDGSLSEQIVCNWMGVSVALFQNGDWPDGIKPESHKGQKRLGKRACCLEWFLSKHLWRQKCPVFWHFLIKHAGWRGSLGLLTPGVAECRELTLEEWASHGCVRLWASPTSGPSFSWFISAFKVLCPTLWRQPMSLEPDRSNLRFQLPHLTAVQCRVNHLTSLSFPVFWALKKEMNCYEN